MLTFLDGSQAVDPGLSARFYSATNAAAAASLALPAAVAAAAVILAALA